MPLDGRGDIMIVVDLAHELVGREIDRRFMFGEGEHDIGSKRNRVWQRHLFDEEVDRSARTRFEGCGRAEDFLLLKLAQQDRGYDQCAAVKPREQPPVDLVDGLKVQDKVGIDKNVAFGHGWNVLTDTRCDEHKRSYGSRSARRRHRPDTARRRQRHPLSRLAHGMNDGDRRQWSAYSDAARMLAAHPRPARLKGRRHAGAQNRQAGTPQDLRQCHGQVFHSARKPKPAVDLVRKAAAECGISVVLVADYAVERQFSVRARGLSGSKGRGRLDHVKFEPVCAE